MKVHQMNPVNTDFLNNKILSTAWSRSVNNKCWSWYERFKEQTGKRTSSVNVHSRVWVKKQFCHQAGGLQTAGTLELNHTCCLDGRQSSTVSVIVCLWWKKALAVRSSMAASCLDDYHFTLILNPAHQFYNITHWNGGCVRIWCLRSVNHPSQMPNTEGLVPAITDWIKPQIVVWVLPFVTKG